METHYEEHPHASVEGGEHHEKKPVLEKVKDKVKKIKNTISKKAHGHHGDDDRERERDSEVSEEEEGYEEEGEADQEVDGAPMYDSEEARHFACGGDEDWGPGKVTLVEAMATTAVKDPSETKSRFDDSDQLLYPSATGTGVGERRNLTRDPSAPKDESSTPAAATQPTHSSYPSPSTGTGVDERRNLTRVPSAPKDESSTPAAATQPSHPSYPSPSTGTGGDEVGESPLPSSFQALAVSDKPKGTEGVRELSQTPQHDTPKEGAAAAEQMSSSYTDKISSTATAAKDAAISAAIGSTEYGMKIASTVYDKVSESGTAIMGRGTTGGEKSDDVKTGQTGQPEKKGVSVKEYVVGKLRPGDEDRALSEVISDAMHDKKQEAMAAVGTPKAKAPGEDSGSGKGMVEKIKGAVTSWIGAGSTAGPVQGAPPTTTDTDISDTDIKGKEAATEY